MARLVKRTFINSYYSLLHDLTVETGYEYRDKDSLILWLQMTPDAPTDSSGREGTATAYYDLIPGNLLIGSFLLPPGNNSYKEATFLNTVAGLSATNPNGLLSFSNAGDGVSGTATSDQPFSMTSLFLYSDPTGSSANWFQKGVGVTGEYRCDFVTSSDTSTTVTGFFQFFLTSATGAAVDGHSFINTAEIIFEKNRWYHVAFTYDGRGSSGGDTADGMEAYIDGKLNVVTRSTSPGYIGMRRDDANPLELADGGTYGFTDLRGSLSEIAMWDKALTAESVNALYISTFSGPLTPMSGYVSNPYRVVLNERDSATGSYPTILRTTGRSTTLGNTPSAYNDTRAIIYTDANDVHYPAVLQTVDNNKYIRDWIVTPNTTGSIVTTGSVKPFVSDQGLKFSIDQRGVGSPRHNFEPFDESRVYLEDTKFYLTGTSNNVYPGFSSPLDDKIQIVIPIDSAVESMISRFNYWDMTGDFGQDRLPGGSVPDNSNPLWTRKKWGRYLGRGTEMVHSLNDGSFFNPYGEYHSGFKYYNPSLKIWEDFGFQHAPGPVLRNGQDYSDDGEPHDPLLGIGTWYTSFYHGVSNTDPPPIGAFGPLTPTTQQWYPTWEKNFGYNISPAQRVSVASGIQYHSMPTGFKQYQFTMSQHSGFMASNYNDLLAMGYDKLGAATMSGMAPFGPTYHATSSNVFKMSNYIAHPMALEKIVINIPIRVRRKNGNVYANRPDGRESAIPTAITDTVDSAIRDIDNYVFFLYRQSHRPSSVIDSREDFKTSQRYLIASGSVACYNPLTFNDTLQGEIEEKGLPHTPAVTIKLLRNVDGVASDDLLISGSTAAGMEGSFTGSIRIEMVPAVASGQFLGGSRFPHRNYNTTDHYAAPNLSPPGFNSGSFEPSAVGSIVVQDFWGGGTTYASRSFNSHSGSFLNSLWEARGLGFLAQNSSSFGNSQFSNSPPGINFNGVIFDATPSRQDMFLGYAPTIQIMGKGVGKVVERRGSDSRTLQINRTYFGGDSAIFNPFIGWPAGFTLQRGPRGMGQGYPVNIHVQPSDPIGPIGKSGLPDDARPLRNFTGLRTGTELPTLDSSGSYTITRKQPSESGGDKVWGIPSIQNPISGGFSYTIGENSGPYFDDYLNLTMNVGNVPVSTPTPYILLPGDELILGCDAGISALPCSGVDGKMFPPHAKIPSGLPMSGSTCEISGSFLIFETGIATLTLFGSMVKNNQEKLFELNQNLSSDAIHEDLHFDNPVVDEFSIANRGEIAGGYTSDLIVGSIGGDLPYEKFQISGSQNPMRYGGSEGLRDYKAGLSGPVPEFLNIARTRRGDFALRNFSSPQTLVVGGDNQRLKVNSILDVGNDVTTASYGTYNVWLTDDGSQLRPLINDPKTHGGQKFVLNVSYPYSSSRASDPNGHRFWNVNMLNTSKQGALLRAVQLTDFRERYFDTLMPDIEDWGKRSGLSTFISTGTLVVRDELNGPNGSVLVESSSARPGFPSEMHKSNKSAWPYYLQGKIRQLSQDFRIEMRAPECEMFFAVPQVAPGFAFTPVFTPGIGSGLATYRDSCSDQFGPGRSRVHGWRMDGFNGIAGSRSRWRDWTEVLNSKQDPVATYDMCFRKGYDFYFRTGSLWGQQIPTSIADPQVGTGNSLIVSSSNTIRAYYCKGPGAAHGFAYGIQNTRPQYTKAIFRSNRYGQFRDMLEQRRYGKFFVDVSKKISLNSPLNPGSSIFGFGEEDAVVACYFVNRNNGIELVNPYSTHSSNMDFEATSSCPFVEGKSLNRGDVEGVEFLILAASEEFSSIPPYVSDASTVLDLIL